MIICILKYFFWRNSDFIKYNIENIFFFKKCEGVVVILYMYVNNSNIFLLKVKKFINDNMYINLLFLCIVSIFLG